MIANTSNAKYKIIIYCGNIDMSWYERASKVGERMVNIMKQVRWNISIRASNSRVGWRGWVLEDQVLLLHHSNDWEKIIMIMNM